MPVRIVEILHEHAGIGARLAPDRPCEQLHGGHRVRMIGGMEAIADGAEDGLATPARMNSVVLAPVEAFIGQQLPRFS